jgi:hypothetical protein
MYDASAVFSLEVTDISDSFILAQANQFVPSDLITELGDGSATNIATLIPGGTTSPIEVGDIFTNTASTGGSADTVGSIAESFLETGILINLFSGSDGAQIDFTYEFTGLVTASATDPDEFAEALSSFQLRFLIGDILIDGIEYIANSEIPPPTDGGTVVGSFTVTLPSFASFIIDVNVTAAGVAAVPTPTILLLLIPGLVGLIFSRRFSATV